MNQAMVPSGKDISRAVRASSIVRVASVWKADALYSTPMRVGLLHGQRPTAVRHLGPGVSVWLG